MAQPRPIPCTRFAQVVLALTCASLSAWAQATPVDDAFRAAMERYEHNHWAEAYDALARLADAGHPDAARMAWQMWRYGRTLYRLEFRASEAQLARWSRLWGCGGDATGSACDVALRTP